MEDTISLKKIGDERTIYWYVPNVEIIGNSKCDFDR